MWLYLLSLLVIKSVQSTSFGYPYRSLWTYDTPTRSSLHGYLHYLDNNAAGSLVGINNQQPFYAVRQIKYFNSADPASETLAINNSDEVIKARENYLRAVSLQQFQHLKSNIDALRNEGKEPSAEKISKLQILQKIAFTSDFSLIAELPDVKSTLQELEATISGLNRESVQQISNQQKNVDQSQGEIKTYVGNSYIPLVAIDKTSDPIHAHEDHLRIYNEQIAHLKKLELEHQKYVQEASAKSNKAQSSNIDEPIVEQVEHSKALAEFERAKQEHLRLWNEAKLRAEQAGYESGEKAVNERANKQQISALINDQNINSAKQNIPNSQNPETEQFNKQLEQQSLKSDISTLESTQQQINAKSNLKNEQVQAADQISDQRQVVDTPEVVQAREEQLAVASEPISESQPKLQLESKQQPSVVESSTQTEKAKISSESPNQQVPIDQSQSLKGTSAALSYRAEQSFVEETPEVKKEREEQLRLVHEANLRAQYVEQQELKYKHESQTPILKSQNENQQHSAYHPELSQNVQETPEVAKARLINDAQIEKQIVLPSDPQQQKSSETQNIGETAEVQHARDEHLRIFNSIKSHVEQEQAKQNSRSFPSPSSEQNPILDFPIGEERILELESLREAERLQKEQKLLEMDRMREAERLAEEKREMEAELMRLRLEDEQRFEMERLLEEKRVQQEQAELQKIRNGEYQEIIIQNDSVDQQPQIAIISSSNVEQAQSQQKTEVVKQQSNQYASNPFLKIDQVSSEPANRLEHSGSQQSSVLKNISTKDSVNTRQDSAASSRSAMPSNYNNVPQYIPSDHYSSGNKYQYNKDDNIKQIYHSAPSSQPADKEYYIPSSHHSSDSKYQYHKDDNIKQIYHSAPSSQPAESEHYIPSSHHSSGSKYQYNKDDNIKQVYNSASSSQPADTEHYIPSSHHSSGSKYHYNKDDNIKQIYHNAPTSQPIDTDHYIPSSHHSSESKYQYINDDNIKQIYHSVPSSQPAYNKHYIPSSHHSGGSKYHYIKDDNFKQSYHRSADSQTAGNDEALIAIEKATNDHLRAHELVLEQLRLARLQNPSIKDCN